MTSYTPKNEISENDRFQFVTMRLQGQLFGIDVQCVRDIFTTERITHIPLAPPEIAGAINLRGRIVTAIDMRERLKLPKRESKEPPMNITVEYEQELYSLRVDSVGEVLTLSSEGFEKNPPTLEEKWKEVSTGVYKLEKELMIVLNVVQVMDIAGKYRAA